ncbi:MAG: sodium:solute symporter family protein [Spirochaetales bacterium]|nr:sodium:solute symporter family protein [Spirochaetales bacterium]
MSFEILIPVVIIYLGIIGFLGIKGYKGTKNSSDYLLGGRNINPFVMALSYGATFISTSAIVGFGGIASQFGLSLLWLPALNILFGIFIAFIFYGKRTRAMGLHLESHTFPEFLGKRVNSKFVQVFTGVIIFLSMPLYTAAVLIGGAKILEGLLNVPFEYSVAFFSILVAIYVIMGGIKGVMYTDALQGVLMFLGMLFLLVATYVKLGGISSSHQQLAELSQSEIFPQGLKALGSNGWTASPELGSPLWWIIFSSLVFGVGIGVLAQPQLCVRYMTVRSNKELNRAVIIGGIFILITVATPYIVGALSNVYFYNEQGLSAVQATAAINGKANVDEVIPLFISTAMPKWFGYAFMLVIISAAMSTLSSQFHAIGTAISRDVYSAISKRSHDKYGVLISRIGVIISILITVILSFNMGSGIIARATAIFFGIMASGFLAPYTAALFWKRLTRVGMIAGMISGIAVVCFGFLFLHSKEAAVFGICRAITGENSLFGTSVGQFIDPLVFALPVSTLSTIIFSLMTQVENKNTVDECFALVKKQKRLIKKSNQKTLNKIKFKFFSKKGKKL